MKRTGNLLPAMKLAFAMIAIGSFVVVNKQLSDTFPIFLASGMRLFIGALVLNALLWIKGTSYAGLTKKDWGVLFFQSFFGVFLFSFCMLYGLRYTGAMESGIMTSTTPAMIGIISLVFFRERLRSAQVVGILLALLGTLIINIAGGQSGGSYSLIGTLLILCAVAGESVFITFSKLLSPAVTPLMSAAMTCTIGFALFLPFAVYEGIDYSFVSTSATTWSLIWYTGLVVTVLAVLLLNQAMSSMSASTSAVFSALMPVSAVLLSYFFLGEALYWYHVAGILAVLGGIAAISMQRDWKSSKPSAERELSA